jgi:hypothetical protein
MVGVIVATLIAAAVADNFDAPRAWTIVGFVAAAYIVSRGRAKAGTDHRAMGRRNSSSAQELAAPRLMSRAQRRGQSARLWCSAIRLVVRQKRVGGGSVG